MTHVKHFFRTAAHNAQFTSIVYQNPVFITHLIIQPKSESSQQSYSLGGISYHGSCTCTRYVALSQVAQFVPWVIIRAYSTSSALLISNQESDSSDEESTSSGSEPVIPRRSKFEDEEDDSDVCCKRLSDGATGAAK